jgi:hypothetical protein
MRRRPNLVTQDRENFSRQTRSLRNFFAPFASFA